MFLYACFTIFWTSFGVYIFDREIKEKIGAQEATLSLRYFVESFEHIFNYVVYLWKLKESTSIGGKSGHLSTLLNHSNRFWTDTSVNQRVIEEKA